MRRLLFAGLTVTAVASSGLAVENFEITTNDTAVTVRCTGGNQPVLTIPFFKEDVSKVIFNAGNYFKYNPTEAPTYEGGSEITTGQFYPLRDDALGTGPVKLGTTGDAALIAQNTEVTIANKVVFPRSGSYVVGFGDSVGRVTLKSIGTEGSQYHTVRLGRASADSSAVGRITLSLLDPGSEAVRQFILTCALKLTLDGGTLKARSDAADPFFSATSGTEIFVTDKGVTFDSPAGTTLAPGVPLKFNAYTNITVESTYLPANNGFESGSTGWTFATLPDGDSGSEVKTTPNSWDDSGKNPPVGQKFAMLRRRASVSAQIEIPEDGLWRVAFLRGGRAGGYSLDVGLSVSVDGITNSFPAISALDFTEMITPCFELSAGAHTLAFTTSQAGGSHSLNLDEIRLERVSVEIVRGTLGKTGEGALTFDGRQDFSGVPLAVGEGTLALTGVTLSGAAATVDEGAVLSLASSTVGAGEDVTVVGTAKLFGTALAETAVVAVGETGTLALKELDESIVPNGSFEEDGERDYPSEFAPKGGWFFTRDEVISSNSNSGLQRNGGKLTESGPFTPYGEETVWMRECQSLRRTNEVAVAGTYRVSFVAADRKYASSHLVPVFAVVDGVTNLTIAARAAYADFTRYTFDVELSEGKHELRISTGLANNTQGNMVFFDDVSFRRVNPFAETAFAGEVRMASGSTLDLDLVGELMIKDFFVDGVKINGRRSAIERAGVTVTGSGDIRVGDKLGMLLIFR